MPGIRLGPYRIRFFQADLQEKAHVHVYREHKEAKYWLTPVDLFRNKGFREHELNEIEQLLREHQDLLLALWNREMKKR